MNSNIPFKILIVDDEKSVLRSTERILEDFQIGTQPVELFFATELNGAKSIIESNNLAVVLLDVILENQELGTDLIPFIREMLGNKKTQIIIRTGRPGEDTSFESALNYDIFCFLDKHDLTPIRLRTFLVSAVKVFIHKSELIQLVNTELNKSKELNKKLAEAEKKAAMTAMSAGVSHEILNALNSLQTAKIRIDRQIQDISKGSEPDIESLKNASEKIAKAYARSEKIVKDMSNQAWGKEEKPNTIKNSIEDAIDAMSNKIENAKLTIDYNVPEDLIIEFKGSQVSQIFTNLISNSCDAIIESSQGDKITINVEYVDGVITVLFQDNGPGIPSNIRSKIFDQGFSTKKEDGKGQGLGLWLMKGLIEGFRDRDKTGNKLELLDDEKTTFKLTFVNQSYKEQEQHNSNKIGVLIDDDSDIHEAFELMHSDKIDWHFYHSPLKALVELERIKPNIIILDVKLPDFKVSQINKLFEICKGLNIYMLSGYPPDSVKEFTGLDVPRNRYFQKIHDKVNYLELCKPWNGLNLDNISIVLGNQQTLNSAKSSQPSSKIKSSPSSKEAFRHEIKDNIPILSLSRPESYLDKLTAYYLDDEVENHELMKEIAPTNWELTYFLSGDDLIQALGENPAHLLIIDVLLKDQLQGPEIVNKHLNENSMKHQIVYVSGNSRDEIENRDFKTHRTHTIDGLYSGYLGNRKLYQKPLSKEIFTDCESLIRMREGDFSYIKPTILYIDDEPDAFEALSNLTPSDWNLVYCDSPKKAIKNIVTVNPAVIITDFNMPEADGGIISLIADSNSFCLEVVMLSALTEEDIRQKHPNLNTKIFRKPAGKEIVEHICETLKKHPPLYTKYPTIVQNLSSSELEYRKFSQNELNLRFKGEKPSEYFYDAYSLKLTEIKSSCRLNNEQFKEICAFWDYNYGGSISDIVRRNIREFVKSVTLSYSIIENFEGIIEDEKGFHYILDDIPSKDLLDQFFDSWRSNIGPSSDSLIPEKANKISLMISKDKHLQVKLNEKLLLNGMDKKYHSHYDDSKEEILKFSRLISCAKKTSSQSKDKPLSVENITRLDGGETSLVDRTKDFFRKLVS